MVDAEEALEMIQRINDVDKEGRMQQLRFCRSRDIGSYNEKNPDHRMKRLKGRRFSFLGRRGTIYTEHYVGGYKSDIYIQDTNTIIEVKSVLSTEKCALFPTVFSERALKQLEKLRDLLSLGYRVHYSVISLNPYVSSIYFVSDAQFTPLLKSCIDLGMTISAFSCRIDDNRVYIDKRLQILLP